MNRNGKILVIRGGAIGDFILTLPVLAALRREFPQARLEVLGYGHVAQLAVAGGLADSVRSIEARALAGFFARGGVLDDSLRRYFGEFAVIISYLYDPDEIFQENVRLCTTAQFLVGPHRPDDLAGSPASEVMLKPLERLAIFDADPIPRLNLTSTAPALDAASTFAAPPIDPVSRPRWLAAHPGSGSEKKNWPEKLWAALLQQLIERTALNILLVGGEAEGDRLNRLASPLPRPRLEIAQNRPLPELALRLSRCDLFVGHDSGISHLAGALDLEGLILWGASAESVWRPPNPRLQILRHPLGLEHLPVKQVLDALAERFLF